MTRALVLMVLGLALIGCGKESSFVPEYATAATPVALCQSGAIRGAWYCDQSSVTAMISAASDGNYVAYQAGTYTASQVGTSCSIDVSTIKTIDGKTTCYITTK